MAEWEGISSLRDVWMQWFDLQTGLALFFLCEPTLAHWGFEDNRLTPSLSPRRENCSNCETFLSVFGGRDSCVGGSGGSG